MPQRKRMIGRLPETRIDDKTQTALKRLEALHPDKSQAQLIREAIVAYAQRDAARLDRSNS